MNGLDLEPFLRIVQTDTATWSILALTLMVLGLAVWAGFGSHKALRKCLILSILAHILLVRYGQPVQWTRSGMGVLSSANFVEPENPTPAPPGIRSLEIIDLQQSSTDSAATGSGPNRTTTNRGGGSSSGGLLPADIPDQLPMLDPGPLRLDRPSPVIAQLTLADRPAQPQPELPLAPLADNIPAPAPKPEQRSPAPLVSTTPPPDDQSNPKPVAITDAERKQADTPRPASSTAATASSTVALPSPDLRIRNNRQPSGPSITMPVPPSNRPQVPLPAVDIAANLGSSVPRRPTPEARSPNTNPANPAATPAPSLQPVDDLAPPVPAIELAETASTNATALPAKKPAEKAKQGISSSSPSTKTALPEVDLRSRIRNRTPAAADLALNIKPPTDKPEIALPKPDLNQLDKPSLLTSRGPGLQNRPLSEVPLVYRSRLDPNRARLAMAAGASSESEKAVEMSLEWLRKHQDADGRWDGGVAKYRDGTVPADEDSFTVHCPPGEICFGECYYWEADTALTGLSLLAYLGAGYTHTQGKFSDTVAKGLDYLLRVQKPDGDLRGRSVAVGMYCHAMATLALCEAYALTGDDRLKKPASTAIDFLLNAQAEGGAAWRYEPRAPVGDTSILGWVVLALRSGRSNGFTIPDKSIQGIQAWLDGVSSGKNAGLAKYQPWKEVTPTMTAEAWLCRWFLNLDTNPKRNREAADYLLEHSPERDPYNLYYWYYGTLSMYQQGGADWEKWNTLLRDRIVKKQKTSGHQTGSWDPDDSSWGTYGGRIYCTALATLTLEVYYRFLRLYDEPATK